MSDLASAQPKAQSPSGKGGFPACGVGLAAPWNEADRLAALEKYAILDTGRESAFDDVAALAADILDAPIAVVNLIAADRQWFKAEVGIGTDSLPLDVSICRHAILQPDVFVVPDLTKDERFDGNPLIHVAGGLRFYAGALLETPDGLPLGTVCVLDTKARPDGISPRQERALRVLASQTMARLELRRSEAIAKCEFARAEEHARRLSLLSEASILLLANADPTTTLRTLFKLVSDRIGIDFAFHYRCNGRSLQLVAAAGLTPEQEIAAARIEFGQTVCGIVAETREAAYIAAIQTSDSPHVQIAKFLGIDSYYSLPLLSETDLLGTLSFGRKNGPFDAGELETLRTLAGQLATALERRQAEQALLALNADLERQVIERTQARGRSWAVSPDLMGALNSDGYFETSNPAWQTLLGWSEQEVREQPIWYFLHPDDVEETSRGFALTQIGQAAIQFPTRCRCKDGSYRWISWIGVPEDGLIYCTGRDVTEQRAQEAVLAERTAELRQFQEIVEASASPICAFDTEYRLIAFNTAHNLEFRRVNGFDTKLGDVFCDLFIPEQQPVMRALMSRALAGERFTVTEEFGRPELGQPLWEISYTPLRNDDGVIIGAFHLATDISDRKRAEADLATAQEALRQSQKMEAMGSLTGGVAHDFNNLLSPIVGSLDLLQRKGLGGAREQRLIDGALQSAERAKTLVQRLLAFARRQPLQAEAVDLTALVQGMAELVASTSGPRVHLNLQIAPDLPPAQVDANQVEMAILNLAVNARDAMPDGGHLTITAAAEMVDAVHRAHLAPGHYLRLSVTDTGEGMDEATIARAIEPFFSTKGVGKGTGLGLSMVHGLAAQLGGGLAISSQLGEGTIVELWLPASEQAVRLADQGAATVTQTSANCGTALLIDDEELVRMSTADMLVELGYVVVEAGSAEGALQLVEDGLVPDIVVTDHLMPGMNGADLARLLQGKQPDLAVLLVSGYADAAGIPLDLPRLTKPFRSADLAAAVGALIPEPRR